MADDTHSPSIEPLASHHDRAAFSCGVEPLDRYLRQQAAQDTRRNAAVTFVLVKSGNRSILGYYTLSATSVKLSELPEITVRKLPKYPLVPAILLGRLAVDRNQRGKGYGELLLMNALKRCLDTKEIGWTAVVVDAKDEAAVGFYEHYHFIRFSKNSNRLFLPRTAIPFISG